jgi:transposase
MEVAVRPRTSRCCKCRENGFSGADVSVVRDAETNQDAAKARNRRSFDEAANRSPQSATTAWRIGDRLSASRHHLVLFYFILFFFLY